MRKFLLLSIFLFGCGAAPKQDEPVPVPTPQPTVTPTPDPGERISYQQMQGLLTNYCQSCHATAQFMSSEAGLRASQAKNRIWSKSMPPSNAPKALPDNTRTLMIGFFGG